MFIIHLRTALRNLAKHRSAGIINIFGLSIGMSAAVLTFLWVQNEMNFDNYHPDADRLFHLTLKGTVEEKRFGGTPLVLADAVKQQVPEIEKTCRLVIANNANNPKLEINDNFYKEKNLAFVDKAWFELFHYDFAEGNKNGFGNNINGIILTQTIAKKYFGTASAIGRTIGIDSSIYQVEAVIKDNRANSSFQFDVLLPIEAYLKNYPLSTGSWLSFSDQTFLKAAKNSSPAKIERGINDILLQQDNFRQLFSEKKDTIKATLEPVKAMHFSAGYSQLGRGDKKVVYIFSILGFLLLAVACMNYVNLTTARASRRSKEVSIKKIIGAGRDVLFVQFMIESAITGIIAMAITLLLIKLTLPVFNGFTGKNFHLSLLSPEIWRIAGGTLLLTILLTGIYPALLLSSFRPLNMLRGATILKIKNTSLRKVLVTSQFTIAIVLIISTIVILKQLYYIQNNNEGYDRSQIFSVSIPSSWYRSHKNADRNDFNIVLKNELQSQTAIKNVTCANDAIQNLKMSLGGGIEWDGKKPGKDPLFTPLSVDADFNKIFNLRLKEGRWFRENDIADQKNYVLNETAVAELELKKPYVGRFLSVFGDTGTIIGIVKDFHFRDYRQKIGVTVIYNKAEHKGTFFIQADISGIKQALAAAESTWKKFFPREPFEYSFMDDEFAQMYKSDFKTSRLVSIFSGIAIFLCCLGLLGLVSFMAEQKIKEIGIRKVLGASVAGITVLLSKDFIKMVLIAVVIAAPVAWWAMNKWLQDFAYRVSIEWWMFAAAGLLTVIIALATISYQAIKAAMANPVKALRSE